MDTKNEKVESSQKRCFLITPIGEPNSQIRRKADGVIEAVIKPVMEELNFDLIVPHKMSNPGSITKQIIEHILNDDMVIANLTGLNANVMYELAVRHASRKPVVCIVETGTSLPFDITTERVVFYSDDMYGVNSLKENLSSMVVSAMSDKDVDNPIYRAKRDFMMQTVEKKPYEQMIADRLNDIENLLNRKHISESNNVSIIDSKHDFISVMSPSLKEKIGISPISSSSISLEVKNKE